MRVSVPDRSVFSCGVPELQPTISLKRSLFTDPSLTFMLPCTLVVFVPFDLGLLRISISLHILLLHKLLSNHITGFIHVTIYDDLIWIRYIVLILLIL